MSKITDAEANATSLDGLVNDNALVPTLRNGPKPSYQYLVDGWTTEVNDLLDRTAGVGTENAYETTAEGIAATVDGDYFSVVSADDEKYLDLYKNESGVAVYKKSYPSTALLSGGVLTLNSASTYPMSTYTRSGGIGGTKGMGAVILDAKITNNIDDQHVRIEAVYNGFQSKYSLSLRRFGRNSDNSSGSTLTVIPATYNETTVRAGIQTLRHADDNIECIVTVDFDAIDSDLINLTLSGQDGYDLFFDLSVQEINLVPSSIGGSALDDLSVEQTKLIDTAYELNRGKNYPLQPSTRSGQTSPSGANQLNAILDVSVTNAVDGMVYRVEYIINGLTIGGTPTYGFGLTEYSVDGDTFTKVRDISVYQDGDNELAEGVVTWYAVKDEVSASITFDGSLFLNNQLLLNGSGSAMYSWIVDPNCVSLNSEFRSTERKQLVKIEDNLVKIASPTPDENTQVIFNFGQGGQSNLFAFQGADGFNKNYISEGLFSLSTDKVLVASGTDNVSPYVVSADSNGDGGSQIFTGGWHGDGGTVSGGNPTAITDSVELYLDGKLVQSGATISADGIYQADRVVIKTTSRIMAYNTITTSRYVLQEDIVYTVHGGSVERSHKIKALEDVTIKTWYNTIINANGYETLNYVGESNGRRTCSGSTFVFGSADVNEYDGRAVFHDSTNRWCLIASAQMDAGMGTQFCLGSRYMAKYDTGKTYIDAIQNAAGTQIASGTEYFTVNNLSVDKLRDAGAFDSTYEILNSIYVDNTDDGTINSKCELSSKSLGLTSLLLDGSEVWTDSEHVYSEQTGKGGETFKKP